MLLDPENGKPLIDWSLELAFEMGLKPVVISRFEKASFNSYLLQKKGVELLLIENSQEWPDTILKSYSRWGDVNLMLLPDTRFAPRELIRDLVVSCEAGVDASFGIFKTTETLDSWGVLERAGEKLRICEKPRFYSASENVAPWGLIAFRKQVGEKLFSDLLNSNQTHGWFDWRGSHSLFHLDSFKDITRKISDLEF